MKLQKISPKLVLKYGDFLKSEEKSPATAEKYIRDVKFFSAWLGGVLPDKDKVLEYKEFLADKYKTASINSIISSLNSFFGFCSWINLKTKTIKVQRRIFADSKRELKKNEYEKLIDTAKKSGNERLYLLMQTICSLGIRVSELRCITVDAIERMTAEISCKGKNRTILIPKNLCLVLKKYVAKNNIKKGSVFITKNGKPLSRTNIWREMKKICERAGVDKAKVFPHNLRHLFARTYYAVEKDIVKLADILGHSNINTTRIYTMGTGEEHRRTIQRMGLLRC